MPAQTFRLAVIAGRQIEAADAVAMTVLLREIHVGAGIVGRYPRIRAARILSPPPEDRSESR